MKAIHRLINEVGPFLAANGYRLCGRDIGPMDSGSAVFTNGTTDVVLRADRGDQWMMAGRTDGEIWALDLFKWFEFEPKTVDEFNANREDHSLELLKRCLPIIESTCGGSIKKYERTWERMDEFSRKRSNFRWGDHK